MQDFNVHPKVFPYLVTKLSPAIYHIIVLPKFVNDGLINEESLVEFTKEQYQWNNLPTCLVLKENDAVWFDTDGEKRTQFIPLGDILSINRLCSIYGKGARADFDPSHESRCDEVMRFCQEWEKEHKNTYVFGDLKKGGRPATPEELKNLNGNILEVPKGLSLCEKCGEYKGECLDPGEKWKGLIMTVNCKCDNNNRCTYCKELLYERKLPSNYFNPEDGAIWHVASFVALDHTCPGKEPEDKIGLYYED